MRCPCRQGRGAGPIIPGTTDLHMKRLSRKALNAVSITDPFDIEPAVTASARMIGRKQGGWDVHLIAIRRRR